MYAGVFFSEHKNVNLHCQIQLADRLAWK